MAQSDHCTGQYLPMAITSIISFLLYVNTLPADFVYDDSRAIITNQDLRPSTPWRHLLINDFWGTPLSHSGSHKSYRPLTVATFRLNYYFNELNPLGYHLVNVLLHSLVTGLVTQLAHTVSSGDRMITWCCGLLFSSHPIHTEAVSSVVGRADLLATSCFLFSMQCYMKMMDWDDERHQHSLLPKRVITVLSFLFCTLCGTLCKEHGFTVLGVCLVYDFVFTSRVCGFNLHTSPSIVSPLNPRQQQQRGKQTVNKQDSILYPTSHRAHFRRSLIEWMEIRWSSFKLRVTYWTITRWSLVTVYGISLFIFRLYLVSFSAPSFSPSDNPAAHSDSPLTRLFTFTHLAVFNILLLLCPSTLSFDWSMDSIPLLERIYDYRNAVSLIVLFVLVLLAFHLLHHVTSHSPVGVQPVTPITMNNKPYFGLDVNGNACPMNDPSLWTSTTVPAQCNIRQCVTNGNVSYKTKFRGRHLSLWSSPNPDITGSPSSFKIPSFDSFKQESMDDQMKAALIGLLISVISFLPATNIFFYVGFVVAERVLYLPSVGYCLLIAVGCARIRRFCPTKYRSPVCACFIALLITFCAKTLHRNRDWLNEERLYTSGIVVNPAKAYSNLGNVYAQKGMIDHAASAYRYALLYRSNMADTHYNYGVLLQERGEWEKAVTAYQNAIKFRPRMAVAYLNLGIALTSLQRHKEAEKYYQSCADLSVDGLKDPKSHENAKLSCLLNLGRLHADQNRYQEAIDIYRLAVERLNPYYQAHSLYNSLGDALSRLGHVKEAEDAFKISLSLKSDHVPAHLTYGHLLAKTGRKEEALKYFERASTLSPQDSVVWQHLGQFLVDIGELDKAMENYEKASRLDTGSFETIFGLANVYRKLGKNELAEELYRKAVLIRSQSSNAHANYGAILHLNKKWIEAEREYLSALELDPTDETTKENLRKLRRSTRVSRKT